MTRIEKLLQIIRSYPILYDLSHKDYKNLRRKDRIWIDIAKQLGENYGKVKKKWKNLRDTYAKYIKYTKKTPEPTAKRIKKWLWADEMKVFRPFLTFTKTPNANDGASEGSASESLTSDTIMEFEENEKMLSQNSENSPDEDKIKTKPPETLWIQVMNNDVHSSNSNPLSATDATSTLANKNSKKQNVGKEKEREREKNRESYSYLPSTVSEVIKYFENKKTLEFDATDYLLLAHAKTIKTFSGKRQAITKLKIAQTIMEQELLHQEEISSAQHQNFKT